MKGLLERIMGKKKPPTALIAKERLTLVLARERSPTSLPSPFDSEELLEQMQQEILAVISRYYPVDREAIKVTLERKENLEVLEVDVVLNDTAQAPAPDQPR